MPPAGMPRDASQWVALILGGLALLGAGVLARPWRRPRLALATAALAAAALSAAYVVVYLRGGPRIIDASSYYLEARAISEGMLAFPLHDPATAVMGRFLVRAASPAGPTAAVIFPPGYPAVLALGFLAHAPLAVGPLLAALLVVVTFALARHVTAKPVAQIAALLSVTCAALRYHTADTMSHGLAGLCFAGAVAASLAAADAHARGLARRAHVLALACGAASGLLLATRPFSAVALAVTLAHLVLRDPPTRTFARRLVPLLILGAIPGVALLLAHQHAATGTWLTSSQRAYYAVSDGPPDCFRYGFGRGIGCLGEHGDFVEARLAHGYGLVAAIGTTARRLKMHLVDAGNVELLAPLVVFGAIVARGTPRGRAIALAVLAQILAYAPFYFDGNYPGGGARLLCDALPFEHVLLAIGAAELGRKRAAWAAFPVGLSLLGFALRAGFDHALLRDRDGGRPLFERSVVEGAGVHAGLVFVDSDHGFDLGFDPAGRDPIQVVRAHGDALDEAAWIARGEPPAFRYRADVPDDGGPARIGVESLSFGASGSNDVIEGESLWPPLAQIEGHAVVEWAAGTCASADRWLAIQPRDESRPAGVVVGLPTALVRGRDLLVRVAVDPGAHGCVTLGEIDRRCFDAPPRGGTTCLEVGPFRGAESANEDVRLQVEAEGKARLDAVRLLPFTAAPHSVTE